MAGNTRGRILALLKILTEQTDENRTLTMPELQQRLEQLGFPADRRPLYEDIEALNNSGWEILRSETGTRGYYYASREFDDAEIGLLLDSLYTCDFLPESKLQRLADKLVHLGTSALALNRYQRNSLLIAQSREHDNRSIYVVDMLYRAIGEGRMVSFMPFRSDWHKRRVFDSLEPIKVKPLHMVDVMDIQSQMEKASETCREASLKPPMTNEEEVRIWLERFALIRERFTDEEVETLLSKNVEIQELYTRHAAGKYTDEEIRLYRFGLCVYLIISATVRQGIFEDPTMPPETMGYPLELFEKVDALPEALKKKPEGVRGYQSDFVGMNDLSSQESCDAYRLYYDGYFFRVVDICLNSAKDLETLENLLNEVSAFEEELRRDHVEWSEQYDETDERRSLYEASYYGCDLEHLWNCLLPEDDPRQSCRRIPVVTNREFLEYVRRTGDCAMDTDQILDDDVYFESMDMGTHARLRFRRENGRYM